MEKTQSVIDFFLTYKGLLTLLILLCAWLVRRVLLSRIRGDDALISEKKRKWMSRTKNGIFVFIVIMLFILWQSEISHFVLSLAAIAVALVVASKEIILCFTGSIQRASSRSFRIGDWIEVGSLCGEVIEHNMMTTVIQEIDLSHGQYRYTGKTTTLPNSMFFTYPIKNLNFMKRYVYHNFTVVVKEFVNLYPILPEMRDKISKHCVSFCEVAARYNTMIEKRVGLDLPSIEPSIHITSHQNAEQIVHFTIFCPTARTKELEGLIRKDFMEMYEQRF